MKKVLIKCDSIIGHTFSNFLNFVNVTSNSNDYTQQLLTSRRLDRTCRLYHSEFNSTLNIGIPINVSNQSISTHAINFELVFNVLEKDNYGEVFLATQLSGDVGDLDAIDKVGYFSRNTKTGFIENLVTGEVLTEQYPKMTVWFIVNQLFDSVYYLVANPEYVTIHDMIDCVQNEIEYKLIDSADGSLSDFVFSELLNDYNYIDGVYTTYASDIGIKLFNKFFDPIEMQKHISISGNLETHSFGQSGVLFVHNIYGDGVKVLQIQLDNHVKNSKLMKELKLEKTILVVKL